MRPDRILLIVILLIAFCSPAHAALILQDGSFEGTIHDAASGYHGAGLWHGYDVTQVDDPSVAITGDHYIQLEGTSSFLYQISEQVNGVPGTIQADLWLALEGLKTVTVAFYGTNDSNPTYSSTGWTGDGLGQDTAGGTGTDWEWVSRSPYVDANAGYAYYMTWITTSSLGGARLDDMSVTVPVPVPGAALLLGSGLLGLAGWRRTRRS